MTEWLGDLLQPALDMLDQSQTRAPVVRTRYDEERAPIGAGVRAMVLRRDKYRCVWCGNDGPLELDHIIPWSAGGSDDLDNLRALCRPCNQRRSNYIRPLDEATTLPHGHWCIRCDPDECAHVRLSTIWCATCRTRAKGVAEADSYGPGRFGIRYH